MRPGLRAFLGRRNWTGIGMVKGETGKKAGGGVARISLRIAVNQTLGYRPSVDEWGREGKYMHMILERDNICAPAPYLRERPIDESLGPSAKRKELKSRAVDLNQTRERAA